MTVTASSIKTFAPEFVGTDDSVIEGFIEEASLFVSSAAWSTRYDVGVKYLTLHLLTMWYRAQPAEGGAAGSGGAAPNGPVKWTQTDNMQVGYGSANASVGAQFIKPYTDAWYESTTWGQAFTSLARMVFPARGL